MEKFIKPNDLFWKKADAFSLQLTKTHLTSNLILLFLVKENNSKIRWCCAEVDFQKFAIFLSIVFSGKNNLQHAFMKIHLHILSSLHSLRVCILESLSTLRFILRCTAVCLSFFCSFWAYCLLKVVYFYQESIMVFLADGDMAMSVKNLLKRGKRNQLNQAVKGKTSNTFDKGIRTGKIYILLMNFMRKWTQKEFNFECKMRRCSLTK